MKRIIVSIILICGVVVLCNCDERKDVSLLDIFQMEGMTVQGLESVTSSSEITKQELSGGIISYSLSRADTTVEIHFQHGKHIMSILKCSSSPKDSRALVSKITNDLNMKKDLNSDTLVNGNNFSIYGNDRSMMHVIMNDAGVTLKKM